LHRFIKFLVKFPNSWIITLGLKRKGKVIELDGVEKGGNILMRSIEIFNEKLYLVRTHGEEDQGKEPVTLRECKEGE
jgi:hypothetical protein